MPSKDFNEHLSSPSQYIRDIINWYYHCKGSIPDSGVSIYDQGYDDMAISWKSLSIPWPQTWRSRSYLLSFSINMYQMKEMYPIKVELFILAPCGTIFIKISICFTQILEQCVINCIKHHKNKGDWKLTSTSFLYSAVGFLFDPVLWRLLNVDSAFLRCLNPSSRSIPSRLRLSSLSRATSACRSFMRKLRYISTRPLKCILNSVCCRWRMYLLMWYVTMTDMAATNKIIMKSSRSDKWAERQSIHLQTSFMIMDDWQPDRAKFHRKT